MEDNLAVKLLSLFETLKMDDACFVQEKPYAHVVYVKDAECIIYELDEFSRHRLPTDRVLAVQYPDFLSDFALNADWILTPDKIAAMVHYETIRFLFVFDNRVAPDEGEFESMMRYKSEWSLYVTDSKQNLPLAILNRNSRRLHLGESFTQIFK